MQEKLTDQAEVAVKNPTHPSILQVATVSVWSKLPRLWEVQLWPVGQSIFSPGAGGRFSAADLSSVVVYLGVDESLAAPPVPLGLDGIYQTGFRLQPVVRGSRMQVFAQSLQMNLMIATLFSNLDTQIRFAARISPAIAQSVLPQPLMQQISAAETGYGYGLSYGILPKFSTEFRLSSLCPLATYEFVAPDSQVVAIGPQSYKDIPVAAARDWSPIPPYASAIAFASPADGVPTGGAPVITLETR